VDYSREVIRRGTIRALVVNSGNANCCTGSQGEADNLRMAELTAECLSVDPTEVAVASTGVIGQSLDMEKVVRGIRLATGAQGGDPRPFMDAILTTDLVEKWAWSNGKQDLDYASAPSTVSADGGAIYGVAKGSGMIAPNMATMLGFLVTDWDVREIDLQASLEAAADMSFNCMTVDGDTSTNDMLLIFANGASGVRPDTETFQAALNSVCLSLARQVARDGEGATKLIEVHVTGTDDPKRIARTIADSPLVKTAMFGCDPNWGRILMAAGRAGVPFSTDNVTLLLRVNHEAFVLFDRGRPTSFDPKRVSTALKSDHVVIDLHLGDGPEATIYTCDFGYGYVRINAEYHT
jgi:glutamate N-acetyltransferase/amino-acid N-acetyltransferase